jgi:hypothetical protein
MRFESIAPFARTPVSLSRLNLRTGGGIRGDGFKDGLARNSERTEAMSGISGCQGAILLLFVSFCL